MRATLALAGILASLSSMPVAATAQPYPTPGKPIRVVVPSSAGGPADVQARVIGHELSRHLGTPVVVENRPGAAGTIAATEVSRASPDGYTLLYLLDALVTQTPHVLEAYPINPLTDLTPVAKVTEGSFVAVAHPSVDAGNIEEFVAYTRRNPGKVAYGSYGVGTTAHIYGEVFKQQTGADMEHIPYQGTAPLLQDILGGRVQFTIGAPSSAAEYVDQGKLVALGVAAPARIPQFPNTPTFAEQGLKGFEAGGWLGVFGPPGLPEPIVTRLQEALDVAARSDAWTAAMKVSAMNPVYRQAPGEFAAAVKADHERWGRYIHDTRIPKQ